ncbi:uncharacterized protein [Antedon mediterranea]|uniref:uncharacterized protein n=1 Tax=Antedon mediterranea TaxID=105859 RepID=UPI003AF5FA30
MVILGDMNIDMNKNDSMLKKYQDFMNTHSLDQIIKETTRTRTESTETIIDHILCSNINLYQAGVLKIGISDHFVTFCTRKKKRSQFTGSKFCRIRSLRNYDPENFSLLLNEYDWSVVKDSTDANDAWYKFKSMLQSILDKVAPSKNIRIKKRTEDWMTHEMLSKIEERDKLLSKLNKQHPRDPELYKRYCTLRNNIQRDIKETKVNLVLNKLEEYNPTLNNFRSNDVGKIALNIEDNICYSDVSIAQHFNRFFTNVASALVNKLPIVRSLYGTQSELFQSFYQGKITNRFFLSTIDDKFIEDQLNGLNATKSTGLDNIPARFLKDGASVLKQPIMHIVNLSIINGIVPDDFKVAKVKPLFKKNSRTDVNNYLPIVSKILERAIHQQLVKYLETNKLIYEFQSGFRKCHLANLLGWCFWTYKKHLIPLIITFYLTSLMQLELIHCNGLSHI